MFKLVLEKAEDVGDCEWNDTKTRHTPKRQRQLWPEEKRTAQASLRFTFISPPWAEFQTVWLSLLSIAHVHECYRTAKGSEIPAYCRVCPEPFLPPYHRKGMFPRLQGTIKLKAVSRLLGRMPHLQARSAPSREPRLQARLHFPYCGCINPSPTISARLGSVRFC